MKIRKMIALLLLGACMSLTLSGGAEGTIPALKDVYAGKFDFGTAAPRSAFTDIKLMKLMKEQFSILTPENELKPDAVLDVAGSQKLIQETGDETSVAVRFDAANGLLRFAANNGLKVHGHTLLWHNQTPVTFFHEGYDSKNPLGARKDRHEKIGEGFIGTEAILRLMRHPALRELPFNLETPNELDGYEREIRMLKELY